MGYRILRIKLSQMKHVCHLGFLFHNGPFSLWREGNVRNGTLLYYHRELGALTLFIWAQLAM